MPDKLRVTLLLLVIALSGGCATKHAYVPFSQMHPSPDVSWTCSPSGADCEAEHVLLTDDGKTQLTPVGCVLHTLITGGHIAWECRKGKNRGRWIW